MLIDSHCHLTSGKLRPRLAEVLAEAKQAGVAAMLSAGADVADSRAAVGLAKRQAEVFCSVGVHPHEAQSVEGRYLDQLAELAEAGGRKCAAVGEIGLDYHYDFSPREAQRRVFVEQLELAVRLGKPVIVHTREAAEETLAVLADYAGRLEGVIHSYTGEGEQVLAFLEQGWHIGFSGIATFKNADGIRAAAKLVPAERLLVETDAPYLTPEPVRKVYPNTPAQVVHVARRLAEVRGERFEDLAAQSAENARRLFGMNLDIS